jgi:hypothetical protein
MGNLPKSRYLTLLKWALPTAIGAAAGYAYYYYIGCVSGTCPISSNPYISTIYGGVMGFLLAPRSKKATTDEPSQANQK